MTLGPDTLAVQELVGFDTWMCVCFCGSEILQNRGITIYLMYVETLIPLSQLNVLNNIINNITYLIKCIDVLILRVNIRLKFD